MSAIFAQFMANLETQMQALSENEYAAASQKVWWPIVMKRRPSLSRKAVLTWLLSTAQLRYSGVNGGSISFDDLAQMFTEVEAEVANAALALRRSDLEDAMASKGQANESVDLALGWAEQIGGAIAMWPQKHAANILRLGHLAENAGGFNAYDGKAFFATDHPLNPFEPELGTYSNLLAGVDAAPIDDSVTLDVAYENLAKVYAHIGAIKMPHGDDFRGLRVKALLVPPKMVPRAQRLAHGMTFTLAPGMSLSEIVDAVAPTGTAMPVQVGELSGFESETTYFVAVEQIEASQLGGMVFLERAPFRIAYYGQDNAQLARANMLEWHVSGRNKVAPGHPYLIFKIEAS